MQSALSHLAIPAIVLFTSCATANETSPTPRMQTASSALPDRSRAKDARETPDDIWSLVQEHAAALAGAPFEDSTSSLPEVLRRLSYDEYRDIRFDPRRALWRSEGLPFHAHFFHRGFLFERRVDVFEVADGRISPVAFSPESFDYGKNVLTTLQPELGFAGLRLHYAVNRPDYLDEVAVFQGASYYRLLGRGQVYGASARGLAIDTATSRPEEFPYFRRFWLTKPQARSETLTVYALLDGPSVSGAYRFTLAPGNPTSADIDATLFFRRAADKVGIAPLTSMFLFGEQSHARLDDYRPEVHDSDGLLLETAEGEWIWRPLVNPEQMRVSAFVAPNPRGFGLMQRDRDFDHYQDLEAHYERRPSLWVKPRKGWGPGHVELLELPITRESDDNVSAYWVPTEPVAPGSRLDLAYRLEASLERGVESPNGRVVATRITAATKHAAQRERDPKQRRFIVDFGGEDLAAIPSAALVAATVTAKGGRTEFVAVEKNPVDGTWRAHFTVVAETSHPVELRAFLALGDDVLTETWSYQWTPSTTNMTATN